MERTPRGETAPPTAATDNPSSAASIPRQEPECDAAAIFPILKGKTTMDHQTIIITQYRPPVDAFVVEVSVIIKILYPCFFSYSIFALVKMPAGLIDANESAESTAVRELLEETGYVGTVKETSMVLFNSPGMSGECMKLVIMDVDLDLDVNKNVVPRLEDGEFVNVFINVFMMICFLISLFLPSN